MFRCGSTCGLTAARREKPTRAKRCLPPASAAATTRTAKSDTAGAFAESVPVTAPHSLGESPGGGSPAVLLPETSLLIVLMYRAGALPVSPLRCSVGAFLVLYLSCFLSPRSSSRTMLQAQAILLFAPNIISRPNQLISTITLPIKSSLVR